jgi:hypothetical protein
MGSGEVLRCEPLSLDSIISYLYFYHCLYRVILFIVLFLNDRGLNVPRLDHLFLPYFIFDYLR